MDQDLELPQQVEADVPNQEFKWQHNSRQSADVDSGLVSVGALLMEVV